VDTGGEEDAPTTAVCDDTRGATAPGECLVLLAVRQSFPVGIALDGANIYWVQSQAGNSSVMKVPAGGGPVTTLLSGGALPLAIGGANVYLRSGDRVMPVRIGDGKPPIPFQGFGHSVAARASDITFASTFCAAGAPPALTVAPVTGATSKTIGSNGCATDLALGAGAVYWTSQGGSFLTDSAYTEPGIMKADLGGTSSVALLGGESVLINHGQGGAGGFAGAGGAAGEPPDAGDAGGPPAADGDGASAAPPVRLVRPSGIVVDAANVYWTDAGNPGSIPADGALVRMALAGGTPTALATGLNGPGDLALDSANLYWASADGTIMRAPLSGGPPTMLAAGQKDPHDIVVDATSVYWVDRGDPGMANGSVVKLTPK
jgi:hypothetical protein